MRSSKCQCHLGSITLVAGHVVRDRGRTTISTGAGTGVVVGGHLEPQTVLHDAHEVTLDQVAAKKSG